MNTPEITIVTVNWYSTDYLVELFHNLAHKASCPQKLTALVIDNTNGKDTELDKLKDTPIPNTIIPFDSQNMTSSRGHAAGLDAAMAHLSSPYTLVIDPDVHVFKHNWDQFCVSQLSKQNAVAVGAPYPGWKLGKYHDFPSPIFNFFQTQSILEMQTPWTPFGHSGMYNFGVFIIRQFARLGGLMTGRNYEKHAALRRYGSLIEKIFGTFSQDTGWRIAKQARQDKLRSIVFQTAGFEHAGMVCPSARNAFVELAREYELYHYQQEIMLAHKYGTGVYLWKTKRGADKEFWLDCIEESEKIYIPNDQPPKNSGAI